MKLTTTAVFIACARQRRCCGWFVSTTASRRNDISVVNVRRSSSSSCKNCNCYNLNLQREFPFHAPSLFWKSLKGGGGGGEYFCSTTTKINPNSLQWNFLGFLPSSLLLPTRNHLISVKNRGEVCQVGVSTNFANLRSCAKLWGRAELMLLGFLAQFHQQLLENHMHEKSAFLLWKDPAVRVS